MLFATHYNGERFVIERNQPTKRMKRIRLNVHHDTRITVSAPIRTSHETIQRFIDSHALWIYQQYHLSKARYQPPPHYRYEQGERHWYLGKALSLNICGAKVAHKTGDDAQIELMVRNPQTPAKVKDALYRWYKQQALLYFSSRIQHLKTLTPWVMQTPSIKVRKMRRQWGNCASSGQLTFNTHLIKAPPECIDYVILHELCHLQVFNHGPEFYALMGQVMPDWQTHKSQLNEFAPLLMVN